MKHNRPAWQYLLGTFVLLIVVQGALRKWVFPGYERYLYFLKDIVLSVGILGFLTQRRVTFPTPVQRTALPLFVGAFVGWTLLEAFNLRLPALSVGLLGIRSHLLYVALAVMVPMALSQVRDPMRLLRGFVLWIAVPVLLLGIYQYFQDPSAWINRYVDEGAQVTNISGYPRITGPFSYITGMGTFLVLCLCLAMGTLFAAVRFQRRRLLWGGTLFMAFSVTVAPMNGSRSVLFFTAIPGAVVLLEMIRQRGRRSVGIVGLMATVALAYVATQTDLALAWETFLSRVGGGGADERALGLFLKPFRRLGEIGFFGFGAGATHQAAPVLVGLPASTWLPVGRGESSFVRLLIELGALGFIILTGLKLYLVYFAYGTMRRSQSAFAAVIGTAAFLFLTVHLVAHVAFNPTAGALYWTLVGVMIFAWSRDRINEKKRQAVATQTPSLT
ncbi:hypothetical protein GGP66_000212 [Salinibacter ruber]|uniref:O-antigen ligase family protein n=1 Tax=Salinibacter ruber TaxID=146919 RepID=UPI002169545F|nr:hypothetical protein [Salinibacter ruber]MCS3672808.1 hypothetical protein [Salinibacter ruber]